MKEVAFPLLLSGFEVQELLVGLGFSPVDAEQDGNDLDGDLKDPPPDAHSSGLSVTMMVRPP